MRLRLQQRSVRRQEQCVRVKSLCNLCPGQIVTKVCTESCCTSAGTVSAVQELLHSLSPRQGVTKMCTQSCYKIQVLVCPGFICRNCCHAQSST